MVKYSQNVLSGSLVPFCAYAGNFSTLGRSIGGLDFPICDKFKPTVLDGQVCYVLDLKEAVPSLQGETEKGKEKGLLLALNMNIATKEDISISGRELLDKDVLESEVLEYADTATLHISTLDRFWDTKPGSYAMTSLKKMTGTSSFLDLPENIKDCQIEDQERCYSRKYIEELQNQCNCLPWALGASIPQKVKGNPPFCETKSEIFQNVTFCSPNANSCVRNVNKRHPDCKISCTGLYAVVWYLGDDLTDSSNDPMKKKSGQKFVRMTSEYHRYLNNYAENLVYASSSESLSKNLSSEDLNLLLSFSFSESVSPFAIG